LLEKATIRARKKVGKNAPQKEKQENVRAERIRSGKHKKIEEWKVSTP